MYPREATRALRCILFLRRLSVQQYQHTTRVGSGLHGYLGRVASVIHTAAAQAWLGKAGFLRGGVACDEKSVRLAALLFQT